MEELTGSLLSALEVIHSAVCHMNSVLLDHVHGFQGFTGDEIRGHANYLLLLLREQQCGCELDCCPGQHHLPALAEVGAADEAVRVAVRGTNGDNLQAGSFSQSMLYRRVLLDGDTDQPMRIEAVELHECGCGESYEGDACPYCKEPFDPALAAMRAQLRLIIPPLYAARWRWRCRRSEPPHFYTQDRCRTVEEPGDGGPTAVQHSEEHDHCPWQTCPGGRPEHPQRGATLWSRARPADVRDRVRHRREGGDPAALHDATAAWLERDLTPGRRQEVEAECRLILDLGPGDLITVGDVLLALPDFAGRLDSAEREQLRHRLEMPVGSNVLAGVE